MGSGVHNRRQETIPEKFTNRLKIGLRNDDAGELRGSGESGRLRVNRGGGIIEAASNLDHSGPCHSQSGRGANSGYFASLEGAVAGTGLLDLRTRKE